MQQVFIPLLFLAVVKSCQAGGTISFDTRLVEVEETDFNQVVLKVERNGTTDGSISFTCTVCILSFYLN